MPVTARFRGNVGTTIQRTLWCFRGNAAHAAMLHPADQSGAGIGDWGHLIKQFHRTRGALSAWYQVRWCFPCSSELR
jgi:hypothetical protein